MSDDWPDYELLDFGDGRTLERYGAWVLDRPCPAAVVAKPQAGGWDRVTGRYDGGRYPPSRTT